MTIQEGYNKPKNLFSLRTSTLLMSHLILQNQVSIGIFIRLRHRVMN